MQYDRTLLVADNRRCEPKKFGGMWIRVVMVLVAVAVHLGLDRSEIWLTNLCFRSGCESEIPKVVSLGWACDFAEGEMLHAAMDLIESQ